MYVLHSGRGTGGFAVQAVLEFAGAQYRLVEIANGRPRPAEILKLNPMGQVPVLELPDGTAMTESAAIVIHLADTLAPGTLAPDIAAPARPAWLRWLVFMAVNIYNADLRLYYPDRYTAENSGAPGVSQSARDHMDAQFAILDQAIGAHEFLVSNTLTAADPYMLMLAHWHPDRQGLFARHANVARVCDAVRELPAVQAANAFHAIW